MIKETKGNIFNFIGENCYIIHQTNTEGVMGGGIAAQIRTLFSDVYRQYSRYCDSVNCDSNLLLGKTQIVPTTYKQYEHVYICNAFAQDLSTLYDGHLTNYDALEKALQDFDNTVGIPVNVLIPKFIGCGIGGGDWSIVYDIIERTLSRHNVTIVDFNGDKLV